MKRFPIAGLATCVFLALGAAAAFAQGRINTSIETAQRISKETGRPILAIAGKKT